MTSTSTNELTQPVSVSPEDAVATMALSWAEVLIVKWFRGDRSITPTMLEAALALAKAGAKPPAP